MIVEGVAKLGRFLAEGTKMEKGKLEKEKHESSAQEVSAQPARSGALYKNVYTSTKGGMIYSSAGCLCQPFVPHRYTHNW